MPHKDPEKRREYQREYHAKNKPDAAAVARRRERERSEDAKAKKRARYQAQTSDQKAADLARSNEYRRTSVGRVNAAKNLARSRGCPWAEGQESIALTLLSAPVLACEACGLEEDKNGRKFCIDHDHSTGLVRGLLCGGCNSALGHAFDDPSILRQLADYLERSLSNKLKVAVRRGG